MGSRAKDPTTPHLPLLSSLVPVLGAITILERFVATCLEILVLVIVTASGEMCCMVVGFMANLTLHLKVGLLVHLGILMIMKVWGMKLHHEAEDEISGMFSEVVLDVHQEVSMFTWKLEGSYRIRASSISPLRRRGAHRSYSPGFERSSGAPRSRGFGNGRNPSRYRESSPPYGRVRDGGRFAGRGHGRSGHRPVPFGVEGQSRNNPNVRPREGDWICSDPSCKNLNFARREYCNNCNKSRYAQPASPRRGYPGPSFPPRQGFPGPPNHSPGRIMNGSYRSPTRGWPRHDPRDFGAARPSPRNEARYPDPPFRSERRDFLEDDYIDRYKYDRPPMLLEWDRRDRGRDDFLNERTGGYGRRVPSPSPEPPLLPTRGWGTLVRERSRSPVRAPPKEFHADIYLSRGRDDRRGVGTEGF